MYTLMTNDVEHTSIVQNTLSKQAANLVSESGIPKLLSLYSKNDIRATTNIIIAAILSISIPRYTWNAPVLNQTREPAVITPPWSWCVNIFEKNVIAINNIMPTKDKESQWEYLPIFLPKNIKIINASSGRKRNDIINKLRKSTANP